MSLDLLYSFSKEKRYLLNGTLEWQTHNPVNHGSDNGRQRTNNLHRPQADGDNAPNKVNNITFIVRTVRVVHNTTPFVCLDTILVYHPLQRRTGTETIIVDFGWDAGDGEKIVVGQLGFVPVELHFLDLPIDRDISVFYVLQVRIRWLCFVVDVDVCKFCTCLGEPPEIRCEGDMRQVSLEVCLILLTVGGMVEEGVGVKGEALFLIVRNSSVYL